MVRIRTKYTNRPVRTKCTCGCERYVNWNGSEKCWNRFIQGHTWRGRHLSEEHRRNIRENHPLLGAKYEDMPVCGHASKGKDHYLYGKHLKRPDGAVVRGKNHYLYGKGPNLGKHLSEETKCKQRIAAIKRIEKHVFVGGQVVPGFSLKACKFFKTFDKSHDTKGRHATNGGEYHIKSLGYFPDYINFDLKLIMEWDEEHHYIDGKLKKKDRIRQQQIQKHFPNFEFRRIREIA